MTHMTEVNNLAEMFELPVDDILVYIHPVFLRHWFEMIIGGVRCEGDINNLLSQDSFKKWVFTHTTLIPKKQYQKSWDDTVRRIIKVGGS